MLGFWWPEVLPMAQTEIALKLRVRDIAGAYSDWWHFRARLIGT